MAFTTKRVTNLRQCIKTLVEQVGRFEGESKSELTTQVTFRKPNNQGRTAANVNLAWNAKNITKIITVVEALNDLMTKKTYLYKKLLSQ